MKTLFTMPSIVTTITLIIFIIIDTHYDVPYVVGILQTLLLVSEADIIRAIQKKLSQKDQND